MTSISVYAATNGYITAKNGEGNPASFDEAQATIEMMEALIEETEMLLHKEASEEVESLTSEEFGQFAYYSINDPETWLGFVPTGWMAKLCESYELMAEMAAEGKRV